MEKATVLKREARLLAKETKNDLYGFGARVSTGTLTKNEQKVIALFMGLLGIAALFTVAFGAGDHESAGKSALDSLWKIILGISAPLTIVFCGWHILGILTGSSQEAGPHRTAIKMGLLAFLAVNLIPLAIMFIADATKSSRKNSIQDINL